MERWWRLWRQPETAKRCDCDGVRPRLIAQAKRGTPILCFCSALFCSVLVRRRRRRKSARRKWEETKKMDMSRWVVIYPVYINSKKTLAEGRRISTSKACENPTVVEIGDCCQYLKLPCAIEVCMYLSLSLCVSLSLVQSLLQVSASDSSACDKGLHFLLFHPVSSLDPSACNKGLHFLLLHPVSALDSSTCDNKGLHFLMLLHLESVGLLWFLGTSETRHRRILELHMDCFSRPDCS